MARIALKVDVDTLRGTREGVPRLLNLFDRRGIRATFLFSVGPDHTGWALRRVFRPGFLSKVSRTSVVRHYGLRTLAYGVLLPGPDIGGRAAGVMRSVLAAGHECGLHAWDHVRWQDNVRNRDGLWTRAQMQRGYDRFTEIFGVPPSTHGAAGWQINDHGLSQIDAWSMRWASDGRGSGPYRPMVAGEVLQHVQWPTTLPTFDEVLGCDGVDESTLARTLVARTRTNHDEVFTLHAELEGGLLCEAFEALVDAWLAQGRALMPLASLAAGVDAQALPGVPLAWGEVPGRSGELVLAP